MLFLRKISNTRVHLLLTFLENFCVWSNFFQLGTVLSWFFCCCYLSHMHFFFFFFNRSWLEERQKMQYITHLSKIVCSNERDKVIVNLLYQLQLLPYLRFQSQKLLINQVLPAVQCRYTPFMIYFCFCNASLGRDILLHFSCLTFHLPF